MSATPNKLPVNETVGQAIGFTLRNLGLMVRLSWLWIVIMFTISVVSTVLLNAGIITPENIPLGTSLNMPLIAGFLFYSFALSSIAVRWHRAVLLGEGAGWFMISVGRRVVRYWLSGLAILLISLLPLAIAMLLIIAALTSSAEGGETAPGLVLVGALIGGSLLSLGVLGRLMLVLPGIAAGDQGISFARSFRHTEGSTWQLLGGLLEIYVIGLMLGLFMPDPDAVAVAETPLLLVILAFALIIPVSFVLVFVTLSYMSYCYSFFVPPSGEGELEEQSTADVYAS